MKLLCRIVTGAVLLLAAIEVRAQVAPTLQVYAGYSLLRPTFPESIAGGDRSIRELAEFSLSNVLGWNSGATMRVWRSLGVTADVSGYYRSLDTEVSGILVRGNMSAHTFLFGPTYSMKGDRVRPFVHVLAGVGHLHAEGVVDTTNADSNSTAFAGAFGGGVDVAINPRLSLRGIQFDYFPVRDSHQGGLTFRNIRWGTGLVWTLSR